MAINTSKVVLGGLAAGVVLNVIDFVANMFFLGDRMTAEANAFKAGLGDNAMTGSAIAGYVITDFIVGILIVWMYAAIRPRFGPGPRTATYVAIFFWIFGSLMTYGYFQMGMMSAGLWLSFGLVWLVNLILAAWVGARVYSEDTVAV